MNDSMSILLATTVLALGGLGLYVVTSTPGDTDNQDGGNKEEKCNDESIFGSSSIFNWGGSDDKEDDGILDNETEETELKPRKKTNTKTQRNKKSTGSSRRRYY